MQLSHEAGNQSRIWETHDSATAAMAALAERLHKKCKKELFNCPAEMPSSKSQTEKKPHASQLDARDLRSSWEWFEGTSAGQQTQQENVCSPCRPCKRHGGAGDTDPQQRKRGLLHPHIAWHRGPSQSHRASTWQTHSHSCRCASLARKSNEASSAASPSSGTRGSAGSRGLSGPASSKST